jgi:hypothetical protein
MDSSALILQTEEILVKLWENLRLNGVACEYGESDSMYLTLSTENKSLLFTVSMGILVAGKPTALSATLQISLLQQESTSTSDSK